MKFRIFMVTMMAAFMSCFTMNAQALNDAKFTDNMSVTVKTGVMNRMDDFGNNVRPMFGVEVSKQLTPVTRFGIETELMFGTSDWGTWSPNFVDHQYVGVLLGTNWMNLFGTYSGQRRVFEIETVVGAGWGHAYKTNGIDDNNTLVTRAGANFNFNVGKERAWTLTLAPGVMYNVHDGHSLGFNVHRGFVTLQAGVTYHFKNHDGRHTFTRCNKVYTQSQWDEQNSKINEERAKERAMTEAYKKIAEEKIAEAAVANQRLQECEATKQSRTMPAEAVYKYPVQFKQGSSELSETSYAGLKQLATDLNQSEVERVVVGYASVEGDANYNQELSERRAKTVYDKLVSMGVSPEKITFMGRGATDQFSKDELELNRIVVIE